MKLISNQINPHFNLADSFHAVGSLILGSNHKKLTPTFDSFFQTQNYVLTNTARTALGLICDTVKPDPSKRIALPAFICAVVATPFISRGYEIEWIDTDENGLIDINDFAAKAAQVSLVVVPHVFGQAAPLPEIKTIAQQHDIFVVEDGAHLIRQTRPRFKTIADAQILSFGREKVISCVSGGALLWPEKSPYAAAFSQLQKTLKHPGLFWTIKHALQPLIFSLSLPWWQRGGKIVPWLALKLKVLPLAVTSNEKKGHESVKLKRLALAQKRMLARQIQLFDQRTIHAQAMALSWKETLKKLFPDAKIIIPNLAFRVILVGPGPHTKEDLCFKLESQKSAYHLRDWDGVPISPKGISYKAYGYRPGQCPKAEYYARTYLTFPTNQRVSKADIKAFAKSV